MEYLSLEQIRIEESRKQYLASFLVGGEVHICISYVSEFSSAKVLREFIDEICTLYNISMKWRTRLVLIVDELNNNAIEYGSKKGDTNFLEVHIKRGDKKNISFCARVQDTGNGERAKTAEEMEILREEHRRKDFSLHQSIRGRGLFLIISRLVDTLSFYNGDPKGLIVEVEIGVD